MKHGKKRQQPIVPVHTKPAAQLKQAAGSKQQPKQGAHPGENRQREHQLQQQRQHPNPHHCGGITKGSTHGFLQHGSKSSQKQQQQQQQEQKQQRKQKDKLKKKRPHPSHQVLQQHHQQHQHPAVPAASQGVDLGPQKKKQKVMAAAAGVQRNNKPREKQQSKQQQRKDQQQGKDEQPEEQVRKLQQEQQQHKQPRKAADGTGPASTGRRGRGKGKKGRPADGNPAAAGRPQPAASGAAAAAASGAAAAAASGAAAAAATGAAAAAATGTVAAAGAAAAAVALQLAALTGRGAGAAEVSCNWQVLKQQLAEEAAARPQANHFKRNRVGGPGPELREKEAVGSKGQGHGLTSVVALDCEMVGVGPGGTRDVLARVSIVNNEGNIVLDTFVAPSETVVDYRTWVSGVRPSDLEGAPPFEQVQQQVSQLLDGRIIVGHGIRHDLQVLLLSHPGKMIRDTARYPPFMFIKGGTKRPKSLKQLAAGELGLEIQEGSHSSVDDARAALYLYHNHRKDWEHALKAGGLSKLRVGGSACKPKLRSRGNMDVGGDPMADL